jgi:hypothetical protein
LYKQLRNLKVEQVPIGQLPPYAKNAQKPSFFNRLGGCSVLKEQGDDHWLAGTGPNSLSREFFDFGAFSAIPVPNRRANSIACSKIPYAMEQGMFLH